MNLKHLLVENAVVCTAVVCFCLPVYIITPVNGQQAVITFDDLANSTAGAYVPNGYQGLSWNNFGYLNGYANDYNPSGYPHAVISPSNVSFNWSGTPAWITASQRFNFDSAYLTAAWRDSLQLEVLAYRGSTLTYSNTYTLSATNPALINFNYVAVNMVYFNSFGGTPHSGYTHSDEHFAMDNATITIITNLVPKISLQPQNQTVNPGANVTFSVGAASALALSYQWQKNGVNIDGATNAILILTNVHTSNTGIYNALVSNLAGSVTSSGATLIVGSLNDCDVLLGMDLSSGSGRLVRISPQTGQASVIGGTGFSDVYDIALTPDGRLFGVAGDSLLAIDPSTGQASLIATLSGVSGINALTSDSNGQLYGATATDGRVVKINPWTGVATTIGYFGSGLVSSGDIVFATDGTLYGTAQGNPSDLLIKINPQNGAASAIGQIGFKQVYGLAFDSRGVLYGAANGAGNPVLIVINPLNGLGNLVGPISNATGLSGLSFLSCASPGSTAAVSNVRASQRAGTDSVDIWYDLSGVAIPVFVSASVSTNAGASFNVSASHFTGDGVSAAVGAGSSRHIVWNSSADLPSILSRTLRVQLSVAGGGSFASAISPIFTLDTRTTITGTLTGRVLGNASPLVGAQVRLEQTPYAAVTDGSGTFTIAGIPAGSGYAVWAAADGYAAKRTSSVAISSGTKNLGDIALTSANRPYRVIPVVPDVNPPVTKVEEGGIAYRYYQVVAADGTTPVVSSSITLRISGGSTISQAGDVSDVWAGRIAGLPDADGIVRLSIPSSALGAINTLQTLQVLESGAVQASFQAGVVPRQVEWVWKHKVGVSVGGSVGVVAPPVHAEGRQSYSTEIRHTMSSGQVTEEHIKRTRDAEARAGFEDGPPGIVLLGAGASAKAGVGLVGGVELSSEYNFDPGASGASDNALKLYLALGDDFSYAANPLTFGLYDYLRRQLEPYFLGDKLVSASGEARLGVYGEVSAQLGWKLGKTAGVGFTAEFSDEMYALAGVEQSYQPCSETVFSLGCGASASASAQAGVFFSKKSPKKGFDLSGLSLFVGADGESRCKLHYPGGSLFANQVEFEQTVSVLPLGVQLSFGPYQIGSGAGLYSEYSQKLSLNLPSAGDYQRLLSTSPYWDAAAQRGSGLTLKPDMQANLIEDMLDLANQTLSSATYELSVYTADKIDTDVGGDLLSVHIPGVGALDLSGDLAFSVERGVEAVNERGRLWRINKPMALEAYPRLTASQLPADTIVDKERVWVTYAIDPLRQAVNQAINTVAGVGSTLIQAGQHAVNATLTFEQNVMAGGSQVISSWVAGLAKGASEMHPNDKTPPTILGPLPPLGASNYIYGVSGIYRFASSNSFNGTGTLGISYSAAQVAGLYEADLGIYRLDDNTDRWLLVGGTVDMVSNIVTATITNLGTYALAPPLPIGDLWLLPSTNLLTADGLSQMTVRVTNLLLNTGMSATQAWLFTVSAVGVSVLNSDMDLNTSGIQVVSTNAAVTLQLRAPVGGTYASVSLKSVAGDAYGQVGINLADNTPPATPTNVSVTAGQSRIWVSWRTSSEPDFAGYRLYYRMGQSGPPWDGTAAVEGAPSPVALTGTNYLLRGLALWTNYFVAVSAVDTTGNESPLSPAVQVTTTPGPPAPPNAVSARFGQDGTNVLMWALSEDDGYNDRDVMRYDVLRAVLPDGIYVKVGEAAAGIGLYSEINLTVAPTQYLRYAVVAVASNGVTSSQALANRLMASGTGIDNDGDGIPDWWMNQYFGHPTGQASDQSFAWNDPAGDGLSNLQKYLLGLSPLVPDRPYLQPLLSPTNGSFALNIQGLFGRSVTLEVSTNLTSWQTLTNLASTNAVIYFQDSGATNSRSRFYRAVVP